MINTKSEGILLLLSSPSGAGKTTIARAIHSIDDNTTLSVSYTTRPMRSGEVQYQDYHFIDKNSFLNMVEKDEFLEHTVIYDNLYGTPKDQILKKIALGKDVIFDIDWHGAKTIKKQLPQQVVSIFILPPSLEMLKERLTTRASETEENLHNRFKKATEEMAYHIDYDFVIVNDDLDKAIKEVHYILKAERLRNTRRPEISQFVSKL